MFNYFVLIVFVYLGWGTIYFGGPTSDVLQEVNVRIWNNKGHFTLSKLSLFLTNNLLLLCYSKSLNHLLKVWKYKGLRDQLWKTQEEGLRREICQ